MSALHQGQGGYGSLGTPLYGRVVPIAQPAPAPAPQPNQGHDTAALNARLDELMRRTEDNERKTDRNYEVWKLHAVRQDEMREEIAALARAQESNQVRLDSMESQLQALRASNQALRTSVEGLQAENRAMRAENQATQAAMQAEIQELKGDVKDLLEMMKMMLGQRN